MLDRDCAGQCCHIRPSDAIDRHLRDVARRVQLGDALIAATALEHGLTVLTANAKHFSPINGLRVEVFIP